MGIPEDNPASVMDIITATATARDAALTAIAAAEEGDFAEATKWVTRATNAKAAAQKAHNHILSLEAQGNGPDFSVLLVHAETHLTDATAMTEMARHFIKLYRRLDGVDK